MRTICKRLRHVDCTGVRSNCDVDVVLSIPYRRGCRSAHHLAPVRRLRARPAATDTSDPGLPFGPASVGGQTIAYVQDIKPIFDRDCLECHSSRNPRGNYSVSTYAETVAGQRPGDARSSVVVDCSPGGSMYRYFRGDAVTEATMVFRWMVVYNAAQTR
jgi:hypothetical protein